MSAPAPMPMKPPQVYAFEGIVPVIDPEAWVHPSAVLIGDVIVGPRCYVGAGAVIHGCRIGRNALVGIPAKPLRELSEAEVRGKHAGTLLYQELAERSGATMHPVDALTAVEPGRARSDWAEAFARLGI